MRTLRVSLVGTVILMLLGGRLGRYRRWPRTSRARSPLRHPGRSVRYFSSPSSCPMTPRTSASRVSGPAPTVPSPTSARSARKIYLLHMPGRAGAPERLGRDWTTVATGTLADDGTITLDYGVVPRGEWWVDDYGTMTGRVAGRPARPSASACTTRRRPRGRAHVCPHALRPRDEDARGLLAGVHVP